VATDRQSTTSAGQVGASQASGDQPAGERLASHPVVGFIPWIVFWVIAGPATWETRTLAALLAAIFVTMLSIDYQPLVAWVTAQPDRRRVGLRPELSRLKLLDIATSAAAGAGRGPSRA